MHIHQVYAAVWRVWQLGFLADWLRPKKCIMYQQAQESLYEAKLHSAVLALNLHLEYSEKSLWCSTFTGIIIKGDSLGEKRNKLISTIFPGCRLPSRGYKNRK